MGPVRAYSLNNMLSYDARLVAQLASPAIDICDILQYNSTIMCEVQLGKLQEADANDLFSLVDRNRQHLKKFIWEVDTQSASDSKNFISVANHKEAANGAPTRGVFANKQLIGLATLHMIDWSERSSALGYWIDAAQTGNGYATHAVRQLLEIAFLDLNLDKVTACIEATNYPSLAVLGRLGFTLTSRDYRPTWRVNGIAPIEVDHLEMTDSTYIDLFSSLLANRESALQHL